MIATGSILTLSITATTGALSTADSVVAAVSADLATDGRLSVVGSPTIGGSLLNSLLGTLESLSLSQPFQVTMQVITKTDFASQDDPLSIVENFFDQETGVYPTAGSTTAVQAPGATTATATGEPGATATTVGGASASAGSSAIVGTGISDSVSNFFSSLTSTAKTLLIALVAILILVFVLIAYGPNVGKIAAAAA
jgi:hypothetical protein